MLTAMQLKHTQVPTPSQPSDHSPQPNGNYTIPPAEPNYNNYNNYNSRP